MLAYAPVRNQLDDHDLDTIAFLQQGWHAVGQEACEAGIAAGLLYLEGIGIANEGVDIVLSINEAVEGNYIAIAGALPFVPARFSGEEN